MIYNTKQFEQFSDVPHGIVRDLETISVMPTETYITSLKANYSCHIAKIGVKQIPALSFLDSFDIATKYSEIIKWKINTI